MKSPDSDVLSDEERASRPPLPARRQLVPPRWRGTAGRVHRPELTLPRWSSPAARRAFRHSAFGSRLPGRLDDEIALLDRDAGG